MSLAAPRVVITGASAETCLGSGVEALWRGLAAGKSGLALDPEMEALGLRCRVSGRLRGVAAAFAEDDSLSPKEKAYFGHFSQIGWLAAREALRDAGIGGAMAGRGEAIGEGAIGRGGVFLGSGIGAISELEDQFRSAFGRRRPRSPGHAVALVMPSFLPAFLASRLDAALGGATVSLACNSGLVALEQAVTAIRSGRADWALAGGVEEDSPYTWSSFDAMRALARTSPGRDPAVESPPFSANAHGMIPSGAGAFLVVESEEHATRRGARVRGSVLACQHRIGKGRGASPTAFDSAGFRAAVEAALREAGASADRIDLVIPHANSTSADEEELLALDATLSLSARGTPVMTPKSLLGHSIGASGPVDLIVLLSQLERGHLIGNHHIAPLCPGLERLGPSLLHAAGAARLRRGLKTGHAFGGSSAAVIFEAPPC